MTIEQDVLHPNPSPFIELFELDLSSVGYTYSTEEIDTNIDVDCPFSENFLDLQGHTVEALTGSGPAEIALANMGGGTGLKINIGNSGNNTLTISEIQSSFVPTDTAVNKMTQGFTVNYDFFLPTIPAAIGYILPNVLGVNNDRISTFYHKTFQAIISKIYYDYAVAKTYPNNYFGTWHNFNLWVRYQENLPFAYQNADRFFKIAIDGVYCAEETFIGNTLLTNPLRIEIGTDYVGISMDSPTYIGIRNLKMYPYGKYTEDFVVNPVSSTIYLTNNTSGGAKVSFNGNVYEPWPLEISGLEFNSSGSPARPTLTLGNLDSNKQLRKLAYTYNDLVGTEVTYIRTFKDYLGINSNISAPKIKFTIGRKLNHTNKQIQFELRSQMDRENSYLPPRIMLREEFPGLAINRGVS